MRVHGSSCLNIGREAPGLEVRSRKARTSSRALSACVCAKSVMTYTQLVNPVAAAREMRLNGLEVVHKKFLIYTLRKE